MRGNMKKLLVVLLAIFLFGCSSKDPLADKKATYKYYIYCQNDGFFESSVKIWTNEYAIQPTDNNKYRLTVLLDDGFSFDTCDRIDVTEQKVVGAYANN